MQSFDATLNFDPYGIIQTILVAFVMKNYRACTGMLSSENDDLKFLKNAKNIKSTCIMCTIRPGLEGLFHLSKLVRHWAET